MEPAPRSAPHAPSARTSSAWLRGPLNWNLTRGNGAMHTSTFWLTPPSPRGASAPSVACISCTSPTPGAPPAARTARSPCGTGLPSTASPPPAGATPNPRTGGTVSTPGIPPPPGAALACGADAAAGGQAA
eukprot:scaffold12567_cov143-Isochrysis_galbana.AAC.5